MLDERDMELLRALFREEGERIEQRINTRMEERFRAQDERIGTMFQEQRRSIMHDVQVLMDAGSKPRFDLLAEELQVIREKMISEERMEEVEADIQVLKTSVRMMDQEIQELKRA